MKKTASISRRPHGIAIFTIGRTEARALHEASQFLMRYAIPQQLIDVTAHKIAEHLPIMVPKAEAAGANVFIVAAGAATYMPAIVASLTQKPVIGVPIITRGCDNHILTAAAQTPFGVPVAVTCLDGGLNAALLALEILALSNPALSEKLRTYRMRTDLGASSARPENP
jgi:5-(carboxyamino)imidazole ribonucleotide mutase